jgi:hypothetical protein
VTNAFAEFVLVAWIPFVVLMFVLTAPRRALLTGLILGWLLLPPMRMWIPGFFDYAKNDAIIVPLVLGVLIRDRQKLSELRFSSIDLLVAIVCITPAISSLTNDLGSYDALSAIWKAAVSWAFPYFLGKLYFGSREGIRDYAIALFVGGLLYVPFCVWEFRMSPTTCAIVYGFSPAPFLEAVRLHGYRPVVFMQHGIQLGLWMCVTMCVGIWLWRVGRLRRIWTLPAWLCALTLTVTAVLCRSLNALILSCIGLIALWVTHQTRRTTILIVFALLPVIYIGGRFTGLLSGREPAEVFALIDEHRAQSYLIRIGYEDRLIEKANERLLFGWGGWGRSRVYDQRGQNQVATDGYWIIAFGQTGLFGMIVVYTFLILPTVLVLKRLGPRRIRDPGWAPVTAVAVFMAMYVADSLMNGMLSPVYHVAIGALAGIATDPRARSAGRMPEGARPIF